MPNRESKAEQWYFEDLDIGDEFDYPSQTVTETHYQLFAGITGDFHPIHLNKHYVQEETEFDERIAHGMLNTMFTVLGASDLAPHIRESADAFLSQSSRFLNPVYVGDSIYPEVEIVDKEDKGDKGIVAFETRVFNHNDDQILEGELVYFIACRND